MDEIACKSARGSIVLRADSLSFTEIPGQTRLFTTYQTSPLSLKKYYPSIVDSHFKISDRIPEVLQNQGADRVALCDALDDINRRLGAGVQTLDNIELLRDADTVAVVTGQQAGLFTGPLYTLHKAVSAIRMADCLTDRGFKAVPVFWAATEDHDFDEVSNAFDLDNIGNIVEVKNQPAGLAEDMPVGFVDLDDSIERTIEELFDALPATENTTDLRSVISEAYAPGIGFGEAFERMILRVFRKYGLVIVDPLDERLKKLASPIYAQAILKAPEIVEALIKRSEELTADGFHAQVLVTEDYFPLFGHSADHARHPLRKNRNGKFQTQDGKHVFSLDDLAVIAENEPWRLSPAVVLRSVVQDYLLPTVCYFGGGAEIAYFAQNSEVYRILERPVTPILHRQSFTIIEPKQQRVLDTYGLDLKDLFSGIDEILPRLVAQHLDRDGAETFADSQKKINTEIDRLEDEIAKTDPTLAQNLANRRRKINYHIDAVKKKFNRAALLKDETIHRRIESLFDALLPHKGLQERTLNAAYYLDRYGEYFIDWLYSAVDLSDRGHRVIYL